MNNTYPHPIIAREGWPYLGGIFIVTLIVHAAAGLGWAWPFWLLTLFVLQFFRDPARTVPTQANAILSPADGCIVAVEQVRDPYADRDALKISVFMNVFNVHSNRAPVDGTVQQVQYFPASSSTPTWTRPRSRTSATPWCCAAPTARWSPRCRWPG